MSRSPFTSILSPVPQETPSPDASPKDVITSLYENLARVTRGVDENAAVLAGKAYAVTAPPAPAARVCTPNPGMQASFGPVPARSFVRKDASDGAASKLGPSRSSDPVATASNVSDVRVRAHFGRNPLDTCRIFTHNGFIL